MGLNTPGLFHDAAAVTCGGEGYVCVRICVPARMRARACVHVSPCACALLRLCVHAMLGSSVCVLLADLEADAGALRVNVGQRRVDRRAGRGQEARAGDGSADGHGELPLPAAGEGQALDAVGRGGGRVAGYGGRRGIDGGGNGGVGEPEAVAEAGDVPRISHCPFL
jgi:hypothetical protein